MGGILSFILYLDPKPMHDDCCEDLLCWEKCFADPEPIFEETYNQIYKVQNALFKNKKSKYNIIHDTSEYY